MPTRVVSISGDEGPEVGRSPASLRADVLGGTHNGRMVEKVRRVAVVGAGRLGSRMAARLLDTGLVAAAFITAPFAVSCIDPCRAGRLREPRRARPDVGPGCARGHRRTREAGGQPGSGSEPIGSAGGGFARHRSSGWCDRQAWVCSGDPANKAAVVAVPGKYQKLRAELATIGYDGIFPVWHRTKTARVNPEAVKNILSVSESPAAKNADPSKLFDDSIIDSIAPPQKGRRRARSGARLTWRGRSTASSLRRAPRIDGTEDLGRRAWRISLWA